LLRDEKITALAVDPGNRKWIGTENGLWLFSADGSELIHHFTTNNSPLPSNVIQSVAVLPQSGEVFVSTDQGLVSYRGSAAEGTYRHQQVRVFPNPVRPDYQGLVSIDGLSYNGNVRITDIAGRLVKEINSAGGRAVWDLTDYQGHPVFSGVYLFFSASIDGQETFVGKIAVIK
jgi:ligand-binding sensor domain-containing protein